MINTKRKAFRYRIPATPLPNRVNRLPEPGSDETLSGIVQGKQASDIEERFARALDKHNRVESYEFIVHNITGANLPGEVQLDFLVQSGGLKFAVQIDGGYAHASAEQKAKDAIQDARLSEALQGVVAIPLPVSGVQANGLIARVPGYLLETQDDADRLVRLMF